MTPITCTSLKLSPHPTMPGQCERCVITLSATPPDAWVQRFASASAWSAPQVDFGRTNAATYPRPTFVGGQIIVDFFIPQATVMINEVKAAVSAANTYINTVYEPAQTAAAAVDTARASARSTLETSLNALLP